jgi:hypothetical protein
MSADDIFGPETDDERAEAEGHPIMTMLDPFGPEGRPQFIIFDSCAGCGREAVGLPPSIYHPHTCKEPT